MASMGRSVLGETVTTAGFNFVPRGGKAWSMEDSRILMTICGAVAALIAVVAWVGDHRRHRRKHIDRVGFMPWTAIFFFALMAAVLLLGLSARGWLAG